MLRAVPSTIFMAPSIDVALRSASFVSAPRFGLPRTLSWIGPEVLIIGRHSTARHRPIDGPIRETTRLNKPDEAKILAAAPLGKVECRVSS